VDITEYLRLTDGVARRRDLLAAGFTDRRIAAAVRSGRLRRLRRGWVGVIGLDPRIVAAVAAGGRVSCASALAARGVWVLHEDGVHVAVPDGSHHRSHPGCRIHHRVLRTARTRGIVESPPEALEQLWHCASPVETVIAVDSALGKGLVTPSQLVEIFDRSRRGRWILDHADGRSQSGTETLARLALRRRHVRLRPQVVITGVGRVDVLIGDRLVLELDSIEWHTQRSTFEADRRRDLDLAVLGYLVVRVTYRRVIADWPVVERDLLTLVRRGEHRWRARHDHANTGVENDA
jgi:very-short-patch-repair endonuclease